MNKMLLTAMIIGLMSTAFIQSGKSMIRAGRDMAPFHTDGRDADFVQEMFNKAYRRKYSKRGISVSLIFTGHFNLNIRLFDEFAF